MRRIIVLTALSIVTLCAVGCTPGRSRSSSAKADADPSTTSASLPSAAEGKLVGGCDRSDTFYKDCTESYAPDKVDDEKKRCDTLGGKYLLGGCPRIGATSQCLQGNPPYLSGSIAYEGRKTKTDPSLCRRGFTDYTKQPARAGNASPASCNAIATSGTCTHYSAVTADVERICLEAGGQLVQPPEPCPTDNGLAAYKMPLKDGTIETAYYYKAPYTDLTGKHTWTEDDIATICGLTGKCSKVDGLGAATSGNSAGKKAPDPKRK